MKIASALALVVLTSAFASAAHALQVPLTPANIVGGSGAYNGQLYNAGQFQAWLILDKQTGLITETNQIGGDADGGYWINSDNGPANAYIVVDLGQAYRLDTIELFNTHNAQFNDRGTGQFTITAGNAVTNLGAAGLDLTGPTATLVMGVLSPEIQANDPLNAQAFAVTDPGSYRYLRFNPQTVAAGGSPCCGANVYGLNELRVFTAVPEPGMVSLVGLGVVSLLNVRRRRA